MAFMLGARARDAGYRLIAFDSIGSTNAEALARARAGACDSAWFVTTDQTAGRGRRNRAWVAPRGNLASSVVEIVQAAAAAAATLGFAAGLALASALDLVSAEARLRAPGSVDLDFRLKWPNDVLAGSRKIAGILLEAEAAGQGALAVVVGIGTNVVAAPEGTPYPAISLRGLGIDVGAEDLFRVLSDAWAEQHGIWNNGRGFGEIRRRWLARAAGLGQPVSVQAAGGLVEGTFETIDETGCLIVATADGRRIPVTAGDVYFGAAASAGVA